LVTIAFVVVGTLNLLAFVYLSGHGEYAPTSYSQDYLSGSKLLSLIFPLKCRRFPVLSSLLYGEESLD
jgi:hypothetical protein